VSPAANDNQDEMAEPECAGTSKLFRLDMLMWLAVTAAFYSVHHCHMRQAPQNTSTTWISLARDSRSPLCTGFAIQCHASQISIIQLKQI